MINFWLTIKSLLLVKLSQLKHLNSTERCLTRITMKKFFDSLKVWTFSTCESRLRQRKLPNRAQKSPQQRIFLTKNFFQRTCLLNSGPGLFFSTIVKISWKLHRECFFSGVDIPFQAVIDFFFTFQGSANTLLLLLLLVLLLLLLRQQQIMLCWQDRKIRYFGLRVVRSEGLLIRRALKKVCGVYRKQALAVSFS